MTTYLGNAFSIQMLTTNAVVSVQQLNLEQAKDLLQDGFQSCVGHADTARVYETQLDLPVQCARISVSLAKGDTLVVGQIVGGRLPEGSTVLPEGCTIRWMVVRLVDTATLLHLAYWHGLQDGHSGTTEDLEGFLQMHGIVRP